MGELGASELVWYFMTMVCYMPLLENNHCLVPEFDQPRDSGPTKNVPIEGRPKVPRTSNKNPDLVNINKPSFNPMEGEGPLGTSVNIENNPKKHHLKIFEARTTK